MRVVISQPMLFPWVGLLEQVRLAGVFVHYDDVQFSKGSFTNRVQIKTPQGPRWMTVPVKGLTLGQHIEDVEIQAMDQWVPRHIALLEQSFSGAPYADDAMALVRTVYSEVHRTIGTLARASLLAVSDYFGLSEGTRFIDVRDLDARRGPEAAGFWRSSRSLAATNMSPATGRATTWSTRLSRMPACASTI